MGAAGPAPATQSTGLRTKSPAEAPSLPARPRPGPLVLHFGINSAAVRPADRRRLTKLAAELRGRRELHVQIGGHADRTGQEDFNEKLSIARASAVRQALIAEGVSAAKLTSRGFGSTEPVPGSEKRESWYRNRRVEVRVE